MSDDVYKKYDLCNEKIHERKIIWIRENPFVCCDKCGIAVQIKSQISRGSWSKHGAEYDIKKLYGYDVIDLMRRRQREEK
jgi:hypothetical protein